VHAYVRTLMYSEYAEKVTFLPPEVVDKFFNDSFGAVGCVTSNNFGLDSGDDADGAADPGISTPGIGTVVRILQDHLS